MWVSVHIHHIHLLLNSAVALVSGYAWPPHAYIPSYPLPPPPTPSNPLPPPPTPSHLFPPPLLMQFCLLHRKQLASYLPEGVIASKKRKSCPEQLRGNIVADGGVGGSRVAGSKRLSSPTSQTDSLAKRALSSGSAHLSPNGSSDLDRNQLSLGADSGVGRSLSILSDASCDVSYVRATDCPPKEGNALSCALGMHMYCTVHTYISVL